jgi:hypothetical protein
VEKETGKHQGGEADHPFGRQRLDNQLIGVTVIVNPQLPGGIDGARRNQNRHSESENHQKY